MTNRTAVSLILGVLVLGTFNGCAYMANAMRGIANRIEHKQELADIRQETRERLADEKREALRSDSRISQLESQLCKAGQEALQRRVEAQIRDKVDSQLAFNVSQGLEVGELEVDVEALKKIIKDREAQERPREPQQRGPLQKGPYQKSSLQKSVCDCDEQECGCRPGLWKKFCHKCKHKKCDCEKDCGGPEALQRLAEQEPLTRPLRPAEIPMKLPVRLAFGMANPRVLETKVRQEVPPEALRRGPDQEPLQRDKVKGGGSGGSSNREPEPPSPISLPLPPVPVPDLDARTTSLEKLPFDYGYARTRRSTTQTVSFNRQFKK